MLFASSLKCSWNIVNNQWGRWPSPHENILNANLFLFMSRCAVFYRNWNDIRWRTYMKLAWNGGELFSRDTIYLNFIVRSTAAWRQTVLCLSLCDFSTLSRNTKPPLRLIHSRAPLTKTADFNQLISPLNLHDLRRWPFMFSFESFILVFIKFARK